MTQHSARYVLIGGGLASATAAENIRKYDLKGGILIVGSETHLPYNRPPLSKEYLRGEAKAEEVLPIQTEAWYMENAVTLLTGTKAAGANTKTKVVTLENGDTVRYEKLLIATGASPKSLDVPGTDGPNVRLLRTWEDSDALRTHLGQKIILVGGGYIGVEVAADFVTKGGQATIIEPTDHLWSKFASPEYGAFLKKKLEAAGAEIMLGDEVTEIIPTGVKTKAGKTIDGDVVLVAVGVKPNLEFALASGLDVDEKKNGVLVNEFLQSSAPDVYAAGDIAGFQDPVLGKQWRVEHWNNAFWHGEIAGANMAGQKIAYNHVANFFSDELDIHFELFGDPQGGKGGLFHGEPSSNRFDELYLDANNRIVMVISVNPPKELYGTLEKLARTKPDIDDLKEEIRSADFDLDLLLALD
jgi:3-phenylpropionate/trans-cinnamate dioxygenase ferredoxin reductase subunit